jgi:hypothetical protein
VLIGATAFDFEGLPDGSVVSFRAVNVFASLGTALPATLLGLIVAFGSVRKRSGHAFTHASQKDSIPLVCRLSDVLRVVC